MERSDHSAGSDEPVDGSWTNQRRWRHLRQLSFELRHQSRSVMPRRMVYPVSWLTLGGLIALVTNLVVSNQLLTNLLIGFFALLAIFSYMKSSSLAVVVDRLLSVYSPLDLDAYRDLQRETREMGRLDPGVIMKWIDRERFAIGQQERLKAPSVDTVYAFLQRNV